MRYSLETKLESEKVKQRALAYFKDELGLKVTSDEGNTLCLEGGGGHVTLLVCPGDKTRIEIETQEWYRAVTQFMTKIRR